MSAGLCILLVLAVAVVAFVTGVWAALYFKLAAFQTLFGLNRRLDQLKQQNALQHVPQITDNTSTETKGQHE